MKLLALLFADFQVIFERDPAARNWLEVLCCYQKNSYLKLLCPNEFQKVNFLLQFILNEVC
ncbi:hypothetical protein CEN46_09415 [Fischerella thermalis CCMEE 5318]|uniref:Uncharacterized protein n=1 Tax=Fischerella thermalis CCMEE 5318 TaxID=2019666 RepID=A0A2N6LI13_9CYAN|nr:hypothetical protein CEN46_09415 [Fischerella thermalis CCMEE 5318]PMB38173.1 hypothetical protein CEN47_06975 [Fischerella thermalis CCMEE 5319]